VEQDKLESSKITVAFVGTQFSANTSNPKQVDFDCETKGKIATNGTTGANKWAALTFICPYHKQVVNGTQNNDQDLYSPLARFLAEGPSEQATLYARYIDGKAIFEIGCTCQTDGSKMVQLPEESKC